MRCYGFQNEVKSYLNRLERENGFRVSAVAAKAINDRVESLKKSRVWSQYSLGFNDKDGDAYLTRANVTDLIGRSEVLWFARGMKALGLYQNMVAWPMRNYQNAGTGSTVYSLGGLGIYNGTSYNNPSWGTAGISFTGTQYITLTPSIFNNWSAGTLSAVYNRGATNGTYQTIIGDSGSKFELSYFGDTLRGCVNNKNSATFTDTNLNKFNNIFSTFSVAEDIQKFYFNTTNQGTTIPSGTTGTTTNKTIGGTFATSLSFPFTGSVGFLFGLQKYLSADSVSVVNKLYKQTLGNGLGLS